jgi:uncharacterized membrane protein
MKDNSQARRSVAKALCWETFSYFLAMLITYWYLQDFNTSLCLTSILFVIKTVLFFVHERIWHQVKWGKVAPKETTHV